MSQNEDTVGVVVPMFNAERTIARTLDSICGQSHPSLDIVVVDDGSTDGSRAIVEGRSRRDPRVRLVECCNGGVAAARNAGAMATDAAFLAFIDADDLWAPTKIASQLGVLRDSGEQAGLVYCWFASIDATDRVVSLGPQPLEEGRVLQRLCSANWIGNGSSIMVRRTAFETAGGYDLGLHARHAQGAEDLQICLRLAEHTEFRVVPRYLVGYRHTPDNMSSNSLRMYRSTEMVLTEFLAKYPQFADDIDNHLQASRHWFGYRAAATFRVRDALQIISRAVVTHPVESTLHFGGIALGIARSRLLRRLGIAQPEWPLYTRVVW